MSVVESLKKSGVDLNIVLYNTLFDACFGCRDLRAAEDWIGQIKPWYCLLEIADVTGDSQTPHPVLRPMKIAREDCSV